jgi:dienelactone hydrolase
MDQDPCPLAHSPAEVELRRIRAPEFVREDKQGVTYLVARGSRSTGETLAGWVGPRRCQPCAGCDCQRPSADADEILPIDSVTLTETEFLTGVTTGLAAKIAGELRAPRRSARAPAVVMIHGSSGIRANAFRWADELLGLGVAVFIVDSFGGRGIPETAADQSQLNTVAMTVDAYRALAVLGRHPGIDAERIAVMGFSKGGFVPLYSSLRRFQRFHGPPGLVFAAHITLYPPCQRRFIDGEDVSGRPIRVFHGEEDDWVPIGPCREYVVERLRRAGKDATLVAYRPVSGLLLVEDLLFDRMCRALTERPDLLRRRDEIVLRARVAEPHH